MLIDHHYHLGLSFLSIWNLESALLEFLAVMRGLACLYVYHNMSICVCQVSVCHSMSRWLMTCLDIIYVSKYVCVSCVEIMRFIVFNVNKFRETNIVCMLPVTREPHTSHPKKYDISMEKNTSVPIVFLFFFLKFSIHVKFGTPIFWCTKTLTVCVFFCGAKHRRRFPEIQDGWISHPPLGVTGSFSLCFGESQEVSVTRSDVWSPKTGPDFFCGNRKPRKCDSAKTWKVLGIPYAIFKFSRKNVGYIINVYSHAPLIE